VLYLVEDNQDDTVVYYGTSNQATASDLITGQTYFFKVSAINELGEGDASDIYAFLIVEPPTSPLNVAVDDFDNTFVTISWELPLMNGGQAISGFKVYQENCEDSTQTPTLLSTEVAS